MKTKYYVLIGLVVVAGVLVYVYYGHPQSGSVSPYSYVGGGQTPTTPGSPGSPSQNPSAPAIPTPTVPVPAEYQALYNSLGGYITGFSSLLSGWDGSSYPVAYSAEVLSASESAQQNMSNVTAELDRDKAMGLKAATVKVGFPIFDVGFYEYLGQSATKAQQTVQNNINFYVAVQQAIHARGMKMIAKTGPLIAEPMASGGADDPLNFYKTLNLASYEQLRGADDVTVAMKIKPDYMVLQDEPGTDALSFRGNPSLAAVFNDPTQDTQMIGVLVSQLNTAGLDHGVTKLGSGAGAWTNGVYDYITGCDAISGLDFIDTHIYNIQPGVNGDPVGEVSIAMKIADMASAAGKGFSMSEIYPHKSVILVGGDVKSTDPTADVVARDTFSFWEPLDAAFMKFIVQMANYKHAYFISFFGQGYFSTYLNYNGPAPAVPCFPVYPQNGVSNAACDAQISKAQIQALSAQLRNDPTKLSPAGAAYQSYVGSVPSK